MEIENLTDRDLIAWIYSSPATDRLAVELSARLDSALDRLEDQEEQLVELEEALATFADIYSVETDN